MVVRAGTSGFSYKEWKGSFYPEDLPDGEMLAYYAENLPAVEINNTFYRMPTSKLLRGWAEQVPEDFTFVLKASRKITHQHKLVDADEPLAYLVETSMELGPRLGPTLFQLPPYLKKDLAVLKSFLGLLPEDFPAAFEFWSSSWLDDGVFDALREHGAALVIGDAGKSYDAPVVRTAHHGYARLRRDQYGEEELREWARGFLEAGWESLYVFFKHEDEGTGPRAAKRFLEIVEEEA